MYSITGVEKEILTIFAMTYVLKEGRSVILKNSFSEYLDKEENEEMPVIPTVMFV